MELTQRKKQILKIVVDSYINTAEPVGSKAIVALMPEKVSSATVRNELADLTDMGYLEQPHTSAGRIPSARGYRLYVNELMDRKTLSAEEEASINTALAKKIAGDGEGATALFEVKVIGAESKEQAVTLSKSVVTSSLTKAAIYGHDANWGRILCAMGYSGAKFDPEKVDLYFESRAGKLKIIENGVSTGYSEEEATKILSEDEVTAIADIKMGTCSATAWGCDLTYDYVKINADYRS